MKKLFLILGVLGAVITQNAAALDDECTPQLDAYIEGMTVGIMLAGEPRRVNNNIQHPERLQALRKMQPDCAIANTIPGLWGHEPQDSVTKQPIHGDPHNE